MSTSTLTTNLQTWASNAHHNLTTATSRLSIYDYIRLVTIVGAYCLLRPYLMKLGARFQAKDHEREIDMDELSPSAKISPNSLRGQVQVLDDSESEEEGRVSGMDWGKKARRRQRMVLRKILDEEERIRREEEEAEDDKEIQEFLVDA
ncbi:MAG: hypothetical protein M1812_001998 [Candelaria pacifica]|nr:MAG: hypothetical protein M1812_001998 [Candelaria pacifica]